MKWGDCKGPDYNTTTSLASWLKLQVRAGDQWLMSHEIGGLRHERREVTE